MLSQEILEREYLQLLIETYLARHMIATSKHLNMSETLHNISRITRIDRSLNLFTYAVYLYKFITLSQVCVYLKCVR